ncbi:MAG: MarR family winged helix-turn-helix transcriptional regulator [Hyphomicrobium sp.]
MVKTIEAVSGVMAMKNFGAPSNRSRVVRGAKRSPARRSDEDSIVDLLHRALQTVEGVYYREAGPSSLTVRQHAIVTAIHGDARLSQADICALIGIDRSTVAEVMRRLVQKGLVLRRRTREDARRYELKLTAKGQAALSASQIASNRTEGRISAYLGPDDRQRLADLLRRLTAAS